MAEPEDIDVKISVENKGPSWFRRLWATLGLVWEGGIEWEPTLNWVPKEGEGKDN